ncbi:4a-hydroxytetrahydrobiopterin dehydratase [Arthrobacter sp. SLBN-112]|jgi:4a-hydroxytetrahydrobiopterin dehydratase|uniref:4a-hydroxytetrahydrobiopterin dehydratase n=1 Tax=Arthrobacter sp. SLBN-112 TaxID=2768452 RepID=UPI0011504C61|nr:4a-hydroxytetrahydrobiopterin dehydratase [Arthrobacter sp. SLBN-112]TQJ40801.1 4a-hydroxytetrahydrobiopterin dehydratase [Arthrobacter sp. SLBN-112]
MTDPQRKLSAAELAEAGLTGWRVAGDALAATFRTRKFSTGLEFVNRIGASAEEANHHPDLTLTYPEVGVTLSSHDVGGITSRDIDMARTISGHAADLGVAAAE